MKKLLFIFLWILVFMSGLWAKEVGKFDLTIKDDKLNVKTTSMTYYFARFESSDGGTWSEPILISPAETKLKTDIGDVNISWNNGEWPKLNYDEPKQVFSFATKETDITPANNFKGWENSVLTFQGGNILELGKSTKYNSWAKPTLFALNGIKLLEIGLDGVVKNGTNSGTISIAQRASNAFAKVKDISESLAYYSAVSEVTIDVLDAFSQAYIDEGKAIPAGITYIKNYHKIMKELIDKTASATGVFSSNEKMKEELKQYVKVQYEKDFNIAKSSSTLGKEFRKELAKSESEDKYLLAGQKALAALNNGMSAYEKKYKNELTDAQKKKLLYAKLGFVTAMAGSNFLDAFLKHKEMMPVALDVIKDVGASAWSVLYENTSEKIPEFIAKHSSQGNLATKIGKVRQGATKAFAGFELGKTIGNKAIPFIFEWLLNPNYVSAGIENKQISLYPLRTKVQLTNENNELIWDSSKKTMAGNTPDTVYLSQNDKIKVFVYAQQEYLWDSERSPWYLKSFLPRQSLYSAFVHYHDNKAIYLKNCVTESLEYFDSYISSGITTGTPMISQSRYLGIDATNTENKDCSKSSAFVGHDRYRYDTMDELYRIKNLLKPILTYPMTIDNASGRILVMVDGYDNISNRYDIKIQTLDVPLTSSTSDGKDYYQVGALSLAPNDSVVKYVWEINNSGNFTTTQTAKVFNQNAPTGSYPVKVWIYTASGNIIMKEIEVNKEIFILANPDTVTVSKNSSSNSINALANDKVKENSKIILDRHTAPLHGSAYMKTDFSIIYTPSPDYVGTDTITYTIQDGNGHTSTSTINIKVTDSNPVIQGSSEYKTFNDGRTDLEESVSFYKKFDDFVALGTRNGKIILLDPKSLTEKSKIVIENSKFKYIDSVVEYIYKKNDDLYVALNVRPSELDNHDADLYIAHYKVVNGKITSFERLFKLRSDPTDRLSNGGPITGMHIYNNYLYVTTGGNLASYDLSYDIPKEITFNWVYGGAYNLVGNESFVYISTNNGNISKYSVENGHFTLDKSIQQQVNYLQIYKDKLITDTSLMNKNLESLLVYKENSSIGNPYIEGTHAHSFSYRYDNSMKVCNLSGYNIDLENNTISETLTYSASSDSYADCKNTRLLNNPIIYSDGNIFTSIYQDKVINFNNTLDKNSTYLLNGSITNILQNKYGMYFSTNNKIIKIIDQAKYVPILQFELESIYHADLNDNNLIISNSSEKDSLILYNVIDSMNIEHNKKSNGFSGGAGVELCENYIITDGMAYSMESAFNVTHLLDYSLNRQPTASRYWGGGIYTCNKNNMYHTYTFSDYQYGNSLITQIYYDNKSGVWGDKDLFRSNGFFSPAYIRNGKIVFIYKGGSTNPNTKNFVINTEDNTKKDIVLGKDFPFEFKDGKFIFYDTDGNEIKRVPSRCTPSYTKDSIFIDNNTLWLNTNNGGICKFELN